VTPTIGVATATSVNKVAITAPATSATLTIANGKTLTASNTLTLTATDGSTLAVGTGGTLGTNAFTSTAFVPQTTTVAGHALTGNVTIAAADISNSTSAGQAMITAATSPAQGDLVLDRLPSALRYSTGNLIVTVGDSITAATSGSTYGSEAVLYSGQTPDGVLGSFTNPDFAHVPTLTAADVNTAVGTSSDWPAQLWASDKHFFQRCTLKNYAISGYQLAQFYTGGYVPPTQWLTPNLPNGTTIKSTIFVIYLGTNDIFHTDVDMTTWLSRFNEMATTIKAGGGYLVAVIPTRIGGTYASSGTEQNIRLIQDNFRQGGKVDVIVDTSEIIPDQRNSTWFSSSDQLHPTLASKTQIARVIARSLTGDPSTPKLVGDSLWRLTPAGTVFTWDMATYPRAELKLTANSTIAITGRVPGRSGTLIVRSGVGGFTLTPTTRDVLNFPTISTGVQVADIITVQVGMYDAVCSTVANQPMAPQTCVFWDDFETAGTINNSAAGRFQLGTHKWVWLEGTASKVAGSITGPARGTVDFVTSARNNGTIEASLKFGTTVTQQGGLYFRFIDYTHCYRMRVYQNGGVATDGRIVMDRFSTENGGQTQIGGAATVVLDNVNGNTYKVIFNGTSIKVYFDGTLALDLLENIPAVQTQLGGVTRHGYHLMTSENVMNWWRFSEGSE
jgi:hypothetical protein